MIWTLFFFILPAFAQVDLSAIQELDERLPNYQDHKASEEDLSITRQNRKYSPPIKVIRLNQIKESGTQMGAINPGVSLRNLESNKNFTLTKHLYVKFFNLEDEHGFKYLQNNDGTVTWRILSRYVVPLKQELALYEPPLKYTPAPKIEKRVYDKKLSLLPEASFYAGVVQGDYFKDLFNDESSQKGVSTQFALHYFTQWKLPMKVGGVLHYERSSFDQSNGGKIQYSSLSLGPQLKTKEFSILDQPLRLQLQFRIGPLAKAQAETESGNKSYKFNSADLLVSIERPIKNSYGEFVLGFYLQNQWLNLKDQTEEVSVSASNETNKSFGLLLSQVFE